MCDLRGEIVKWEEALKNFEYFDPTSVGEAVQLLRQHAGQAKVLAGGTDLFLRMRRRALLPEVVVDLKRIAELSELRYSAQEGLHIGATVTHGEVVDHPAVQQHYGALATAANWVGSLQTRHRGTVQRASARCRWRRFFRVRGGRPWVRRRSSRLCACQQCQSAVAGGSDGARAP